jgi:PBP1b-binding outer membrane lipoprotein LpoB
MRSILILLCVFIVGCGSKSAPDPEVARLRELLDDMTSRVEQLEAAQVTALQDRPETTQFGDVVADRLFVKTLLVVDDEAKPRIGLTATMSSSIFDRVSAKPSILLDVTNNTNANLTMTNAAGNHVVQISSYPDSGSVNVKSAVKTGGLQLFCGSSGPEFRQYQPDGDWINLKQIPVDNPETAVR